MKTKSKTDFPVVTSLGEKIQVSTTQVNEVKVKNEQPYTDKEKETKYMPAPKPALDPLVVAERPAGGDLGETVNAISLEVAQSGSRSEEVDLVARALDVLGSPKLLSNWMKSPLPALHGKTPYSVMGSEDGRKQVATILGRIEHGIY